jgi:Replication-relaxation
LPARSRRAVRADSLRYSGPPGIRAWAALPQRDQALLRWLLSGSVVTSPLAALLAYGTVRTARRRLGRLVAEGLLRGFWAANSQRPRGRFAYALVGSVRDALERREGGPHRPSVTPTPTIHQLATHDLLAAFLQADVASADGGLTEWLPERALRPVFRDYLRPDALAVIGVPRRRITLFIERDMGTEPTGVLSAKLSRYRTVLGRAAGATGNVGIVVDSTPRTRTLGSRLASAHDMRARVWVALAADLLADPYHARWRNLAGETRATIDLPSDPGQPARLIRPLCLLEAEGLEAFEPWTSSAPMLEPFLRGAGR